MDVTFTTKFDAKRYACAVRRALVFSFRGLTIFSWCIMAAWLVFMFDWWIRGCPEVQGCTSLWSLPFFCGCVCEHFNGYWESLKTNHTSSVYLESEKGMWLEKIRPIAKDLYEEE